MARLFLRCVCRNKMFERTFCSENTPNDPPVFHPERVLVLSKMSRYEFEKHKQPYLSEDELRRRLAARGSNYEGLMKRHKIHTRNLESVTEALRSHGVEVKVIQKHEYTPEKVNWADVIMSAGGDGTFLMAASHILTRKKPLIGVNTDPSRSEGYLCLPKEYSGKFSHALDRLLAGKFRWRWRNRIRITLEGYQVSHIDPVDLDDLELGAHDHLGPHRDYRYQSESDDERLLHPSERTLDETETTVLPIRALNEIFIGETRASRTSYYELSVDGRRWEKQKSSGLTVCTGTGSSSWSLHINQLTYQSTREILRIVNEETNSRVSVDSDVITRVMRRYNNSLMFDASEPKMTYTVRDPIINGVFSVKNPRGFAKRITIRSRCWDACLAVDGGFSFQFNDGAMAYLEILPEDALRTVILD
ncbi:NAD kinase 2, mitochondrial-like isoform X1 [Branchiostoma floridae x Branchiostoma japonicum]